MPCFIDKPDGEVGIGGLDVYGWVAAHVMEPDVRVTANGRRVRHVLHDRPDVRRILPGFGFVSGVFAPLTVFDLDMCDEVEIELSCEGDVVSKHCLLKPEVMQARASEETLRLAARDKCRSILVCPRCRSTAIRDRLDALRIACPDCGEVVSQGHRAFNMISDALKISSRVTETDNVSSNPYPNEVLELIGRVTAGGGWVLDCGAGRRPRRTPHVVNVEIVDYGSTDVLAVGEALPFADASFDAAISLAVLEHVRDPFACARELLRVVRPGGKILAAVPFLQPVHGFPNHFYNMTQQGLENLFADGGEILECVVPPYGHPIFAVQWLLREYLAGLPEGAHEEFASMTIGEAAMIDPRAYLGRRPATQLSAKARSIVSCLNTVRVRRL